MRLFLKLLVVTTGCWSIAGCAPQRTYDPIAVEEVLSGNALFGEVIDVSDLRSEQTMALNDELRNYVRSKVGRDRRARPRLEKLLGGMIDDGLLALEYNQDRTYSAIETFNSKQGNCLSFSLLFAALAREAGLELTFQMVDIPPSFRADGEIIFLDKHINVRVKGLREDISFAVDYVVDFNTAGYNSNFNTREVDDSYAIALYFSNLAVEALQAQNTRKAFRYLKKGIETNSKVAEIWVNLGVLYSRQEQYELAETAYGIALNINPSSRSALLNMASALQQLGRQAESDEYSQKVRYYRDLHPYYHYSQAKLAASAADYESALASLATAIKLKKDEHQFYFLRGLVYTRMNNYALAEKDYARARDTAVHADLVSKYSNKLEAVETQLQ